MNKVMATKMANDTRLTPVKWNTGGIAGGWANSAGKPNSIGRLLLVAMTLIMLVTLTGCESDEDCINCVELPPPVVPTGVHSISGDNEVIVQWFDIAYAPYDDSFNENVTTYFVYSRFYQNGDEFNPDREFFFIGEVAWNENYDPSTGLHWFVDNEIVNGEQAEYAIAAVNSAGLQSALSFEFVADAPLPMSPFDGNRFIPVPVFDTNNINTTSISGFDFRQAGLNPNIMTAGVVNPATGYHIKISFEGGIAYVIANGISTRIQDFGVFSNSSGNLIFEGVSWAPADGYSQLGKLELVAGHVYVVEIINPITQELHYAKFGIDRINLNSVDLIWAYQLIAGLPELKAPGRSERPDVKPQLIKM